MSLDRCNALMAFMLALALSASVATTVTAQTTSAVRGTVFDEQGAAIPGATVTLRQPSSGLERVTATDGQGRFSVPNLPLGSHDVSVELSGFQTNTQRVTLTSGVPLDLSVSLPLAPVTDVVTVRPMAAAIDTTSAGTRHAVSVTRIERLPVAVSSRGLEAVLVGFPGFAQNANGAIHPRGAHNQMTFVVDGLPISDQLTGAFANSLDVGVVQTAELLTGNIPAEFGSKVSGVAVLNSRSGLGTGRAAHRIDVGRRPAASTRHRARCSGAANAAASATSARSRRCAPIASSIRCRSTTCTTAARFARGFGRVDVRLARPRLAAAPRHGRPLALRTREPALAAGGRPGSAPGARRTSRCGALPAAHARCRVHARGHRRLPHDHRRTAARAPATRR